MGLELHEQVTSQLAQTVEGGKEGTGALRAALALAFDLARIEMWTSIIWKATRAIGCVDTLGLNEYNFDKSLLLLLPRTMHRRPPAVFPSRQYRDPAVN